MVVSQWEIVKTDTPRISIVMPAYNEEKAIGLVVDGFKHELESHDATFEIVVIDNNSKDSTAEIARQHGARVVQENQQGYGYACIRALKEAEGEFIILTESDQTFDPRDI